MSLAGVLPVTLELNPSRGGVAMRKAGLVFVAVVLVFLVTAICAANLRAEDKKTLIVTAVTHESRMKESTNYHTTPGQSTTDCSGTGTDSGAGTTRINMDCNTTSTPPKTSSITTRITEVSEEVRGSDNMIYTIACTDRPNILAAAIVGAAAGGGASGDSTLAGTGKCKPLIDGAHFDAEIKGTTMWVHARKEGRKVIKIKYRILDIRKLPPPEQPHSPSAANPVATTNTGDCDVKEVWSLGRSLGEKDNEIADAIEQHGTCKVLAYLRSEVDAKSPQPQSATPLPAPPSTPKTDAYTGVGGGHWINEVSSNGAIVTLEDGSLWEISAADRIDTALWLPAINITVLGNRSPVGDYKYTLINKDDGEKALAKYLGKE